VCGVWVCVCVCVCVWCVVCVCACVCVCVCTDPLFLNRGSRCGEWPNVPLSHLTVGDKTLSTVA